MEFVKWIASGLVGAAASWPLYRYQANRIRQRIAEQDREYQDLLQAAQHNELVLDQQTQDLTRLESVETRYNRLKGRLKEAGVTETYVQPVLLVGPVGVGKTSLLTCWQRPWSRAPLTASRRHTFAEVPIGLKENHSTRQHFADPDITTPTHVQLMLRVHDFPGELHAQELIQQIVSGETRDVQQSTGQRAGIVLVCMFDATEALSAFGARTREYYNGDLFQHMRALVMTSEAKLARLLLVFNKVDLAQHMSSESLSDEELRARCFEATLHAFPELGVVCNRERIVSVLTVLDNRSPDQIRGASAVFAESARMLAEAFGMGDITRAIAADSGSASRAAG